MIFRKLGLVCRGGEDGFVHGPVCRPLWGRASGKKGGGLLTRRLVEQQNPIVRRLGRYRAGTVAFGRFFTNRSVMPEEIFAAAAKAALADARQVTLIADRESDFYEGWVGLPDAGFALPTRASRDRKLVGACSGGAYLFSVAADWPEADRMVLDLPPRKARAGRRARPVLKYGTVEICRPRHCSTAGRPIERAGEGTKACRGFSRGWPK